MIFCVENEVDASFDFDIEELAQTVAQAVLTEEKCDYEVEINLIITDDEGIQEINKEFRQIDKPTDVLSFPNVSYDEPGDFSVIEGEQKIDLLNPDTGNISFGDIVINENRVRSQAVDYGHSEKREFAFLVAHSMLHLCGYDHMEEDEAAVMEKKQNDILNKLGITRDN
nr:rRNA maturation RNase YbeY [uncultured Butyrivibrio sp.]